MHHDTLVAYSGQEPIYVYLRYKSKMARTEYGASFSISKQCNFNVLQ